MVAVCVCMTGAFAPGLCRPGSAAPCEHPPRCCSWADSKLPSIMIPCLGLRPARPLRERLFSPQNVRYAALPTTDRKLAKDPSHEVIHRDAALFRSPPDPFAPGRREGRHHAGHRPRVSCPVDNVTPSALLPDGPHGARVSSGRRHCDRVQHRGTPAGARPAGAPHERQGRVASLAKGWAIACARRLALTLVWGSGCNVIYGTGH